jgi:cytochrome c-type biogenesis protein CcmH/NrfG
MRKESVIFGIAGMFMGLLCGWILGAQSGLGVRSAAAPVATAQPAGQPAAGSGQPAAPPVDEARAAALKVTAERDASDAATRVQLANLYFDSERYDEAVRWYEAALTIDPKNIDASTDLGIAYYYSNQPDRALAQFDRSLTVNPKHSKTLLNVGIVRAFAKEDVNGATAAWQRALDAAVPGSPEAVTAKRLLDGIRAHPEGGAAPGAPAKNPGESD